RRGSGCNRCIESARVGITHWDEVERRRNERGQMAGTWSNLGAAAGSYLCGVHRIELNAGEMPTPAHVHGESEEIFYVLSGLGLTWMDEKAYETLRTSRSMSSVAAAVASSPTRPDRAGPGRPDERHEVRTGSVVAVPAGSQIAHTFRGGAKGLTFLA